jgi:SnoaL-like domain
MSICPEVITKLQGAMNSRDVESLLLCFADHYTSEQPFHPERGFSGTEKLRRNWTLIFERVPDFQAEMMCSLGENGMVWSEWRWYGTGFEWRGVILFGVKDEVIEWARVYMEPVELSEEKDPTHWVSRRMKMSRLHAQQQRH